MDSFGRAVRDENEEKGFIASLYRLQIPETACKHWQNLLGAFYGRLPDMNANNLQTVLQSSIGLIDIAESIRASSAIRQSVDIALLRQGQILFRSIAASPIEWGNLAIRIHSPSIFRGAVIHLVGKWNQFTEEDRKRLTGNLREVCEKKHRELQARKKAIEIRILGHYPRSLYRRAGKDNVSRVAYSNDIYWWMAISIYRQWFCQAVSEGRNCVDPDGGAAFYRAIEKAGSAYLDAQDYANFHNLFQMSTKGRTILYDKLRLLKFEVKKYVSSLLVNRSQLDIEAEGELQHLTCCEVTRADMPWENSPMADPVAADHASEDSSDADEESESDSHESTAHESGCGSPSAPDMMEEEEDVVDSPSE